MKGLFIKDLEIARMQKKFFVILLVMAIFLSSISGADFAIGYLTALCAMFVITTVSYDEFDNGYGYLMTLPIQRKDYVKEKYLFGLVLTLFGWFLGTAIEFIHNQKQTSGTEILCASIIMLSVGLGMAAVMLPCVFKFGQEKGRYMFFGIGGGIFGIAYFLRKAVPEAGNIFSDMINKLSNMKMTTISFFILLVVLFIYMISCRISIRIMEKKEF